MRLLPGAVVTVTLLLPGTLIRSVLPYKVSTPSLQIPSRRMCGGGGGAGRKGDLFIYVPNCICLCTEMQNTGYLCTAMQNIGNKNILITED